MKMNKMLNVKVYSKDEDLNKELKESGIEVTNSLLQIDDVDVLLVYEEYPSSKIIEELKDEDKKIYILTKDRFIDYEKGNEILIEENIVLGIKSLVDILQNNSLVNCKVEEILEMLSEKCMLITDKVSKIEEIISKFNISKEIDTDIHLNVMGKNLKLSDCTKAIDKFQDMEFNNIMFNVTELDSEDIFVSIIITNSDLIKK